jgi:hypothetical protein
MFVGLFLVGVLACFVAGLVVAVSADESLERRSRFWVRVVVFAVIPLVGLALVAADASMRYWLGGFAWLFLPVVLAMVCVPAGLFRRSGLPAGPSEDGGQGGSGPDHPPGPPNAPRGGGIPLAHSEQAVARVRDHTGSRFRPQRPHRRSREPERTALARPESS